MYSVLLPILNWFFTIFINHITIAIMTTIKLYSYLPNFWSLKAKSAADINPVKKIFIILKQT